MTWKWTEGDSVEELNGKKAWKYGEKVCETEWKRRVREHETKWVEDQKERD